MTSTVLYTLHALILVAVIYLSDSPSTIRLSARVFKMHWKTVGEVCLQFPLEEGVSRQPAMGSTTFLHGNHHLHYLAMVSVDVCCCDLRHAMPLPLCRTLEPFARLGLKWV